MTLHDDRSYKATRPAGETRWKGVAVSHVGNGRRVEGFGDDPMGAMEEANRLLDEELAGPVAGAQRPTQSEIDAGFGSKMNIDD